MLFLLSPIHTPVHMHTLGCLTTAHRCKKHMRAHAHTHTSSVPLAEGEKRKEKRREKKKSIAGDSGARRRIVSCQNNILPSSPPDRCGGLGTEGSLSPLLSLPLFLPGAWCSLIFTSVKERPRRLSALIDSDTWGSVLRLRIRERRASWNVEGGKKERKGKTMERGQNEKMGREGGRTEEEQNRAKG